MGCRAQAIGYILPRQDVDPEIGEVTLTCGDRHREFPASSAEAIRYPEQKPWKTQQLAQLASEILCAFCVYCPNNLPPLEVD